MREAWSAGALALLAVFTLLESLRLDIGSATQPGPGFFPLVLSAALCAVAAALLLNGWRRRAWVTSSAVALPAMREPASAAEQAAAVTDAPAADSHEPLDRSKLVATVAAFVAYIAVFERLGFIVATVGFLAFLFGALARYRWPLAIAAAVGVTVVAHLVFDVGLQLRLPRGILGR
jgi:hypothetical protein